MPGQLQVAPRSDILYPAAAVKIRSHLVILLVAVLAPVALLAGISIERLWDLQRRAFHQQFLERVSAMRLAHDTEVDGILRTLRTLADVPDIGPEMPRFVERFERLLANNPLWETIGLLDREGRVLARLDKRPLPTDAVPDARTLDTLARTGSAGVSNLVTTADGTAHLTYFAAPVIRDGARKAVLYIGIESAGWLEFLHRYPISKNATLTLLDSDGGHIIARTLNNERWVGKPSMPEYWRRTAGKSEGAFINAGLEGQSFYSAFSRSRLSGWMIGSGVPKSEVEAALRLPTYAMIGGTLVVAVLVAFLAFMLSRRISGAMTNLADAAHAAGAEGATIPTQPLPIAEAETVRGALAKSAALLRDRERSLSAALAEAEQANKAKDQFLAMLGHELRNPLSAMTSAVQIMQLSPEDPKILAHARGVLDRQLRHLTGILNDMLDVSRLASGKIVLHGKAGDLADTALHVVQAFRDSRRSEHIELTTTLQSAPVFGDETRLEQIVSNLLDNACKYSPPGSRITIETRVEGGESLLVVRDTGSGIAPEFLPRIFDVFAQAPRSLARAQGGLGLGLTVVRRLVELHGGMIEAQSDGAGKGATFTVRLPYVADKPRLRTAAASIGRSTSRRIVLVEDNHDNREAVASVLRYIGHSVTTAADGPDGLKLVLHIQPEVAMLDLGLPGLDGLQLARTIRSALPNEVQPVLIAFTGYGQETDRAEALAAGFDAFLIKPFTIDEFNAALAKTAAARSRAA